MSAPALSVTERKEALSGKKKNKKTMKNVLGVPKNLKVEFQSVEVTEVNKLVQILCRLLPTARFSVPKSAKQSKDLSEKATNESQLRARAENRRNQLSLGVNDLNRSIKKDLISAVLIANDIQPKFLIHHLNLQCNYNKIPYLHMPGLREITKNNLGFPCIAVGFKKNYQDFSEAVEEIKLISQTKETVPNKTVLENSWSSNSHSDEEEATDDKIQANATDSEKTTFTYLYRTSTSERIFVPEKCCGDNPEAKSDADFIKFENVGNEINSKNDLPQLKMSSRHRKKKNKLRKLVELENNDSDDEEIDAPKKKVKKLWAIDKVGTQENVKYQPANLMRVPSNPNRVKKR